MVASAGFEPAECKSQSLVPYHLATRQFQVVERHGFEPWNPKEQIYSLPRLATSLSLQNECKVLTLHTLATNGLFIIALLSILYKNGAENRNRTRNLLITSQLLYQLSYFGIKWWAMRDSNSRPPACKADALTN